MGFHNFHVIVAGSRYLNDERPVFFHLDRLFNSLDPYGICDFTIISGAAQGIDCIGSKYAFCRNYNLVSFPANWDVYGKKAGVIRNAEMAKYAHKFGNGILAAFMSDKYTSRGTRNMITQAEGYKLKIFTYMI